MKPLGRKSYGSIGHLPGSRLGPGDHKIPDGQERILTTKVRDRHDRIVVQEKIDGANVGIAIKDGNVLALGRAGHMAQTSPYEQHRIFADWVRQNADRFYAVLHEGERLCGEWLILAHGTRYALPHEPFVAFDLMGESDRLCTAEELRTRVAAGEFTTPALLHVGAAVSIEAVMQKLATSNHGALDPVEGAVWRCERHDPKTGKWTTDFLGKWLRQDKADGKYLKDLKDEARTGSAGDVWNTWEGPWQIRP